MVNVGLIGKIDSIETMAEALRSFPDVHIAGKTSSGFLNRMEGMRYSIPELNRSDLIGKSDVLFFMKGAKLTAELLIAIIKQSKQVFTSDFFYPSPEEFIEIEKLLTESKSIFQVNNPYYYHPVIQWIGNNFPLPAYFDLYYASDMRWEWEIIIQLLMLPIGFLGANPSKFRHTSLMGSDQIHGFTNIRLEFGDTSVFNFNMNFQNLQPEFTLKAYSASRTIFCNLLTGSIEHDRKTVQQEKSKQHPELVDFFNSISGTTVVKTGINEYASVMKIFREISRKNNWNEA
jgi:hypothetical protein